MKTTQQTLEVLAAILALKRRHSKNMEDGKESWVEKIGYIFERGKINKALEGIKEVPDELLDLTANEVPEIAASVSLILNEWGFNHRQRDISNEVIRDIVDSIPVFKEAINRWNIIASLPPTAELVE